MIEIHSHGSQENQPVSFPVFFIVPVGDSTYGYKMKEVMGESLQLELLCVEVVEYTISCLFAVLELVSKNHTPKSYKNFRDEF